MAFASSVSIPYWEDENDESLARGFFGEVVKGIWNDRPVIKRKLQYKKSQFRKFCREAVTLWFVHTFTCILLITFELVNSNIPTLSM